MAQSVKFKRSSVVSNGAPKLPTSEQINVGELAINFAKDYETISTKNSSGEVVTFSSDVVLAKRYATSADVVTAINSVAGGGGVGTVTDVTVGGVSVLNNGVAAIPAIPDVSTKQDNIEDLATIRYNAASGMSAYDTATAHTANTTVHVTAANKSTWNGKQDAISDLATIRYNAASGMSAYNAVTAHTGNTGIHVTSSEKSTWNGKQNAISDLAGIRNNAASGMSAYNTVTAHTANTAIHLPTVSSSDNGKVLQVVNGVWTLVNPVSVYSGAGVPSNQLGNNGDIYIQTS
jgi:hypothetical protein